MHIAYISMGAVGHVLAALPFCRELKKKWDTGFLSSLQNISDRRLKHSK